MLAETTITVFNRYINPTNDTVLFYRSVMDCHFEQHTGKVGSVAAGSNQAGAQRAEFFVPHSCAPKGKTYVKPEAFNPEINVNTFTFSAEDIVLIGDVKTSDYVNSHEIKHLKEENEWYAIISCENNRFGSYALRHWDVTCTE